MPSDISYPLSLICYAKHYVQYINAAVYGKGGLKSTTSRKEGFEKTRHIVPTPHL